MPAQEAVGRLGTVEAVAAVAAVTETMTVSAAEAAATLEPVSPGAGAGPRPPPHFENRALKRAATSGLCLAAPAQATS